MPFAPDIRGVNLELNFRHKRVPGSKNQGHRRIPHVRIRSKRLYLFFLCGFPGPLNFFFEKDSTYSRPTVQFTIGYPVFVQNSKWFHACCTLSWVCSWHHMLLQIFVLCSILGRDSGLCLLSLVVSFLIEVHENCWLKIGLLPSSCLFLISEWIPRRIWPFRLCLL